jgi:hypothetical protein
LKFSTSVQGVHSSVFSFAAAIEASLMAEISFWIMEPIGST